MFRIFSLMTCLAFAGCLCLIGCEGDKPAPPAKPDPAKTAPASKDAAPKTGAAPAAAQPIAAAASAAAAAGQACGKEGCTMKGDAKYSCIAKDGSTKIFCCTNCMADYKKANSLE